MSKEDCVDMHMLPHSHRIFRSTVPEYSSNRIDHRVHLMYTRGIAAVANCAADAGRCPSGGGSSGRRQPPVMAA